MNRTIYLSTILSISLWLSACSTIVHLTPGKQESELRQFAAEVLKETRHDFADWRDARIARLAYPLYRPDIKEVAYYEFPVISGKKGVPAGFILLSTGAHDNRVVQWSTKGRSNVQQLKDKTEKLGKKGHRYFLIDDLSFVVEDQSGILITQLGYSRLLEKKEEWLEFKGDFVKSRSDWIESIKKEAVKDWRRTRIFGNWCGRWKYYWAGNDSDQRYYDQLDSGEGPNNSSCQSGCGATAWAMLFGWVDHRASQNDPVWSSSFGMYGDDSVVAPRQRDASVSDMIWEIRNYIETECSGNKGRTWPWDMKKARQYLSSRSNSSPSLTVHNNDFGIPTNGLRDRADKGIRNGWPVIVSLGWEHYALAWGYRKKNCRLGRDKHEFRINNGHGWSRWTSAGTWIAGQVHPYPTTTPPPDCPDGQKCCYRGHSGHCHCISIDGQCPEYGPISGCPGGVCCDPGLDRCRTCARSHLECPHRF